MHIHLHLNCIISAPCPLPRNVRPPARTRGPLPEIPREPHSDASFDDSSFDDDDEDTAELLNDAKDLEPEFRRFINSRVINDGGGL